MRTKSVLAGLVGISMLLLAGCSNNSSSPYGATSSPAPTNSPPNTVLMANMSFNPATITVAKGTTVTWTNNDGIAHTSTSDNGVWNTGNMPPGSSKSFTFTTAGTFPYTCTYHAAMMKGTVIVQ